MTLSPLNNEISDEIKNIGNENEKMDGKQTLTKERVTIEELKAYLDEKRQEINQIREKILFRRSELSPIQEGEQVI